MKKDKKEKSKIWVKRYELSSWICSTCNTEYHYFEDAACCCAHTKEGDPIHSLGKRINKEE